MEKMIHLGEWIKKPWNIEKVTNSKKFKIPSISKLEMSRIWYNTHNKVTTVDLVNDLKVTRK